MKNLTIAVLSLLILCLVTSCSKKKNDDKYVFPLKTGNTWTLLHTFQGYNINLQQEVTEIDTIYVEVADQIDSPEGEPCYRVEYWSSSDPEHEIGYDIVVNRSDGLYQLGWKLGYHFPPFKGTKLGRSFSPFSCGMLIGDSKEEVWLATPKLLLPRICKEGTQWTYGPNTNSLEMEYTIIPRAKVSVPNGNYTCHVRKSRTLEMEEPDELFDYYAKDGFIKTYSGGVDELIDAQGNSIGEHPWSISRVLLDCHRN